MEVERQSEVKSIDVCDETSHIGFEPQSTLELKDPERFSLNDLIATLRGKAALHQFKKGELVAVSLRFSKYKENGELVNHIIIDDIKLVKELDHLFL